MTNKKAHQRTGLFYVETIGQRWKTQPVDFKSADVALTWAKTQVKQSMRVTVYDCTDSPRGTVVACTSRGDL